jgi:tetrapyrrole methylase family protein/MazG family protein
MRSQKLGSKTKRWNFDWTAMDDVLNKVEEELAELKEALKNKGVKEQEHELGDLLFSIAQLARHIELDAEQSLRLCNQRFVWRFEKMAEFATKESKTLQDMTTEDLESLWSKAKKEESQGKP